MQRIDPLWMQAILANIRGRSTLVRAPAAGAASDAGGGASGWAAARGCASVLRLPPCPVSPQPPVRLPIRPPNDSTPCFLSFTWFLKTCLQYGIGKCLGPLLINRMKGQSRFSTWGMACYNNSRSTCAGKYGAIDYGTCCLRARSCPCASSSFACASSLSNNNPSCAPWAFSISCSSAAMLRSRRPRSCTLTVCLASSCLLSSWTSCDNL